jgi:Protein of unknown function (DUF1670)
VAGLRRCKLLRITGEAYEQSVELSQELMSFDILGCGLRTLQRDITLFASHGVHVPFQRSRTPARARQFTYKVAAARLYLEGRSCHEVAKILCHGTESVAQFIGDFARIARLTSSGIGAAQIQTVMRYPENLLRESIALFQSYNTPQLFRQLDLFGKPTK